MAQPPVGKPLWLAALALVALASASAWLYRARLSRAVRPEAGLNLLLITVDTLRADALGCYGNTRVATPVIDRLAAAGVRFATAHGHNVVTLPSHCNILSGRLPTEHGVRDNSGFRFPENIETLATLLKRAGYVTGAFVSAFPLESRFGLTRGFDVYDDHFGGTGETAAFHMEERRGADTVAAARRWLDTQAGRKTFTWIHVYDPHAPYAAPEPFASRFAAEPYLGEVSAVDAALAPLLEPLLQGGDAGKTLVVLTADHGEALGEHGEATHGIFAYEGTLRVPLILFAPGHLPARVVTSPAQHVDIVPTVLDLLKVAPPANAAPFAGRSLLTAVTGEDASPRTAYFEALSASLNRGWAPLHGVIRGGVKYIDLPLPELYDLGADAKELANLVSREPVRLDEMRSLLSSAKSQDRGIARTAEDADVRERLRGLGYISASGTPAKAGYTDADDPKNLIQYDNMINEAIARYSNGDLEGALRVSGEIVRRKPDMALGRMHFGFLQRQTGNIAEAVAQLKAALALNPYDMDVVSLLGAYLSEAGRSKEAVAVLEPYAARRDADVEVLVSYGINLAGVGRGADAIAAFERVRRIDPSNAMALVNIGTVHLMAGEQRRRARHSFASALAANPSLARAHNSLGRHRGRRGPVRRRASRSGAARWSWSRAIRRPCSTSAPCCIRLNRPDGSSPVPGPLCRGCAPEPPMPPISPA